MVHFAHKPQCTVTHKTGSSNAKIYLPPPPPLYSEKFSGHPSLDPKLFGALLLPNSFHQSIPEHYENKNFTYHNMLKAVPKYYKEGAGDVVACNQQYFFAFSMVSIRKKMVKNR